MARKRFEQSTVAVGARWVALALGWSVLSGCGEDLELPVELTPLQLQISAAVPDVAAYDVRILGANFSCDEILPGPSRFLTQRNCADDEVDVAEDCHLKKFEVRPGTMTRAEGIHPGARRVFLVGHDEAGANIAKGCASVTVKRGFVAVAKLETYRY